jgi:vacuolar-type H+-ATPase subunit I/STV1
MGALIWHEWAHFMSVTSAVYSVWSAYWGLFYRKFFWDFVHGIVRTPGGIQPANQDALFTAIIIKAPIVQLLVLFSGLAYIAFENPLIPGIKKTAIYRSLVLRAVWLLIHGILAVLFYQGTNAALWSFISCFAYTRAIMKGEQIKEAKENRGKGGAA